MTGFFARFGITVFVVLFLAADHAAARSDEAVAAMQRLAPLAGASRVTGFRHGPDGQQELPETRARAVYMLDGQLLSETSEVELQPGDTASLLTQFSFDMYRGVYRIAVTDNGFGLMDIYEGRFVSDTVLIATNLRSDTHFPLDDGRAMHFQLRWDFAEPVVRFDILLTVDGGANWRPYFALEYAHRDETADAILQCCAAAGLQQNDVRTPRAPSSPFSG